MTRCSFTDDEPLTPPTETGHPVGNNPRTPANIDLLSVLPAFWSQNSAALRYLRLQLQLQLALMGTKHLGEEMNTAQLSLKKLASTDCNIWHGGSQTDGNDSGAERLMDLSQK